MTFDAGKLRAVVLIATIRGRRKIVGDDPQGGPTHDQLTYERPSAAVLAVNVPGRAPYAVYAPRFEYPAAGIDVDEG